jgi:hypothetical protein
MRMLARQHATFGGFVRRGGVFFWLATGECLGESALLSGEPSIHSARTKRRVTHGHAAEVWHGEAHPFALVSRSCGDAVRPSRDACSKVAIHRCAKSHRVAAHYNLLQHVALCNVSRLRAAKWRSTKCPTGRSSSSKRSARSSALSARWRKPFGRPRRLTCLIKKTASSATRLSATWSFAWRRGVTHMTLQHKPGTWAFVRHECVRQGWVGEIRRHAITEAMAVIPL